MPSSVATFLMFEGAAEEAMRFYVSLFSGAEVQHVERWPDGAPGAGTLKLARATLAGHAVLFSDSPVAHGFTFTPSTSFFVECADAEEQQRAFDRLAEGGNVLMPMGDYGFSERFAWVADRFGVSWQLNLAKSES